MSVKEDFQVKNEFDDSNFYYQDYNDEDKQDSNQLNDSLGELTTIKTPDGENISVYLRLGNRILFCSGKYFYIEHTTAQTDHQKEYTGIVSTCHTCGVKIKGSLKVSSNFICHLKARHPEVYQDFLKQKQESGAGTRYKKLEKLYSGHRTSPYPTNPPILGNILQHHENQEQFQRNILHFLIATNQSLSLVENANFRKLFEFLDLPVMLKTPYQYEQIVKDDCKYKQLQLANFFNNSKVYICLTSDVWSFGECKYLALSCHWIDEQYQRQNALLACIRSSILEQKCLQAIQDDIFLRYGFQKEYIVNIVKGNIQNYTADFKEFGIIGEAICSDNLDITEDSTLLKQMQDNLELLNLNNEAVTNVIQLDVLGLNKIWFEGFTRHIDVKNRQLHQSCIEKCLIIWKVSHSKHFKENFANTTTGPIIRPNLFSFTSLHNSLKQIYLNKNQLSEICDFLEKPNFSEVELNYLEELVEVFEPLYAAFEFLDMPENHFYGCFLPTLVTLKWKLTRLYNSKKLKHLQELLLKLKEKLLTEFKLYYELNDTKSEAIIAAITYPPVKTRFLMGLRDSVLCFNFQARNLLLKYGKDFHIDYDGHVETTIMSYKPNSLGSSTNATDFFDFGDVSENVDAEELRDVNISKKELSELVAELYDGLMNEGLSMESIDLETPRKFLLSHQEDRFTMPNTSLDMGLENDLSASRQLNFGKKQEFPQQYQEAQNEATALTATNIQNECNDITSTNNQYDYTFHPDIMSTPSIHKKQSNNNNDKEYNNLNSDGMTLIPIAQSDNTTENEHNKTIIIASSTLNTQLELIAVRIPGQPNCYKLAKVVDNPENETNLTPVLQTTENFDTINNPYSAKSLRYSKPYEINYTYNYISVRRHIISEYIDKFKSLKNAQDNKISSTTTESTGVVLANTTTGFTQYQYDLMQQQLRIHIQQLTQSFVQTYCHPELWKLAPKYKELLLDLQEKSKENVNFQVWNLEPAIELIHGWQKELDQDTPQNTELMNFLHREHNITNHQSRQIPRFHPRILECFLNSPVFMYPRYLPRMPVSGKPAFPIFSPVEAYLIAMGLEKHLKIIYEKKEKLSFNTTPLRAACKRLAKDTVCGKRYRRIWDHILHLQNVDYYNPIKYFFEHNKAPPVDHDPIWTFNNNVVLLPKNRIPELPLVFQTYLQKKNEPAKSKPSKNKKTRKTSSPRNSGAFRNTYTEFVQEAVGQALPIPNLFYDPVESSDTFPSDNDSNTYIGQKYNRAKRRIPKSLTINVNYVYGNGLDVSSTTKGPSSTTLPTYVYSNECETRNSSENTDSTRTDQNNTCQCLLNNSSASEFTIINHNSGSKSLPVSTINSIEKNLNNTTTNTDCPVITYNFDLRTKTLKPSFDTTLPELKLQQHSSPNTIVRKAIIPSKPTNKKIRTFKKISKAFKLHRRTKHIASAYREKQHLKRRCEELITSYSLYLDEILSKYKNYPLIQQYYRSFKALELYTYLLKGLKNICNTNLNNMATSTNNSPTNLKRTRNSNSNTEDDNSPSSARQVRKLNRQEENFRHMLLPDTQDELNRKDAIYAFNFYEKVEEAFITANKPEDCKKFNAILKSFDPKKDKVSELYYKLEKLFLPDHPELAQVFLTFLLPSEAVEIGKFFEHFMINNMGTFINKLNVYFNKQPAQIRKIYNCLNDLAEDPDITMKTVEAKIVPLLKGNQFLVDWFMQQFPQSTPPERLFSKSEHINLKYQQCNRSGESVETLTDLLDSPSNDIQQQSCQLRYINGRIFYGSKMLLPAKLSFMATSYKDNIQPNENSASTLSNACVHGIRNYGEKRLQAAADLISTHINAAEPPSSDDQDKSEEEDVSKALVIDTTADEDDSCSSVELCDDASLRAHATRLNPSVYTSTCYSTTHGANTSNLTNISQMHHANAKKTNLNVYDEVKFSPRKNFLTFPTSAQLSLNSPLATGVSSNISSKEKRKSPSKKTKSPLNNSSKTLKISNTNIPPMVVIHETNSAIQCAKRLKSLIEGEEQQNESEDAIESKDILKIVAKSKHTLHSLENLTPAQKCEELKEERSEDVEFLAEPPALTSSPFPCLRIETDSNEEDVYNTNEDPKVDDKSQKVSPLNAAWTRDEDKIILIEMKLGSQNRKELYERIAEKLPERTMFEITSRHHFLIDFLSKLQGK